MINYTIVNGKLQIDAETLTVRAFNDIWNHDQTKTKNRASAILLYIFTLCDERDKNPFQDIEYDRREETCKQNAFKDKNHKFKPDEQALVDNAIAWFETLNRNAVKRLSIAMDNKIDEMSKFLGENAIKGAADFKSQSDIMVKITKILQSKKETDKFVRDEQEKVKTKGNASRSPLAKKMI